MIPTWLQAVVLGAVQGVTEFVPVSSSGHLVLLPYLLGWDPPGLSFDVALHGGTLVALIAYFRRDLWGMLVGLVRGPRVANGLLYRRLALLLAVASVPVAIAGVAAKALIEQSFETPQLAATMLLVTAGFLVAGEWIRSRRVRRGAPSPEQLEEARQARVWQGDWIGAGQATPPAPAETEPGDAPEVGEDPEDADAQTLEALGLRQALIVGVAQILALLPGMSRSGTTIAAGMAAGLTRQAATRFSFLLALPALAGASIVSLPDLATVEGPFVARDLAVGVATAALASYLAIAFLLRFVARAGVDVFARYLVAASAIGWLGYLMIG